ncbi:hypothetical protein E4T47_03975 [Aureobasidium subglaciale]|nr:hypothetical protein E4T47_03975 [Aureobasidium subglaciale]
MSYNEYNNSRNDEYSSTGRQGGFNDRTTGSGAYGDSDNLSGSNTGRDQFNESNTYGSGNRGSLGNDDIADRSGGTGTLGRDEFSGGNTSGSGLGRDEYSSSSGRDTYGSSGNTGRDTFGSSNTDRDNYGSSNTDRDTYGSANTGNTGYGSSRGDDYQSTGLTSSSGIHHTTSAGDRIGDDDLKPSHGIERDTHHSTGGNYPSTDDNFGSGTTGGAGYGNKSTSGRDDYDSSNTRFGSSNETGAYSGSTDFGSGTTGGAGYGNKSTSGRGEFGDSSDSRFGSSGETGAYSGSNEYGSGSTSGAGYGNKSHAVSEHDNKEKSGKSDSTMGKIFEGIGKMTKNEKMVEKGEAKREAAGANVRSEY